jgi:tRNA U34 5-carboxymethylaminomethyl modifying GTPase MnmE/TrmE
MSRATEMDVTMIGLQNAGKTSLLRVLSVSSDDIVSRPSLFARDDMLIRPRLVRAENLLSSKQLD